MRQDLTEGLELLASNRFSDAVEWFKRRKAKAPKCAYTTIYYHWAAYLDLRDRFAGPNLSTWPDRRIKPVVKKHRYSIRHTLFRVPSWADGYAFVGRILLDEGEARRAVLSFEKGLRADPASEECQLWLEVAQGKSEPPEAFAAA